MAENFDSKHTIKRRITLMKIKLILICFASIIFMSCQDNGHENANTSTDLLLGKYMNAEFDLTFKNSREKNKDFSEYHDFFESIEKDLKALPEKDRIDFYIKSLYFQKRTDIEFFHEWVNMAVENGDWDKSKKELDVFIDEQSLCSKRASTKRNCESSKKHLESMRSFVNDIHFD